MTVQVILLFVFPPAMVSFHTNALHLPSLLWVLLRPSEGWISRPSTSEAWCEYDTAIGALSRCCRTPANVLRTPYSAASICTRLWQDKATYEEGKQPVRTRLEYNEEMGSRRRMGGREWKAAGHWADGLTKLRAVRVGKRGKEGELQAKRAWGYDLGTCFLLLALIGGIRMIQNIIGEFMVWG